MKKLSIFCFFILMLTACQDEKVLPKLEIPIKTSLDQTDFIQMGFELKSTVIKNEGTRSENTIENLVNTPEGKEIFQPLIKDGAFIAEQINQFSENLTDEDKIFYSTLSEDQMALLSLISVAYGFAEEDTKCNTRSVDWARLRSCLAFALGVSQIQNLAVDGIITATTIRKAIIAIGKRYLGYVGVALMVWDFYDCFY